VHVLLGDTAFYYKFCFIFARGDKIDVSVPSSPFTAEKKISCKNISDLLCSHAKLTVFHSYN
jgi:predicted N-acetyltransferase YhbS